MLGNVSVDKINPITGTNAAKYGFGAEISTKKRVAKIYVIMEITPIRNKLVSHALSTSTRLLRFLITFSSFRTADISLLICKQGYPPHL